MRRLLTVAVGFGLLLAFAHTVSADLILADDDNDGVVVGSRSTPASSGVIGSGAYASANGGFNIAWDITFDGNSQLWHYEYTFSREDGEELTPLQSHWIFQVSPAITQENVDDMILDEDFLVSEDSPKLWVPGSGGNPGLPSSFYGIKADSSLAFYSADSPKGPVWGHFYSKGGSDATAWNFGLQLDVLPTDRTTDFTNWIPTPDTSSGNGGNGEPQLPEPATAVLFGAALAALSARRRRRR